MISTAEIARTAHRTGVGDRVIEKDYVLSWLLVATAESELSRGLIFKGGTRCMGQNDLDTASLHCPSVEAGIL